MCTSYDALQGNVIPSIFFLVGLIQGAHFLHDYAWALPYLAI
jgi:hypothetical protein